MSKSDRMYKIFMTAMVVVIAGLLLATGIIAIQKSMKMNLSFEANPNYLFEVYIQKSGDDTKKLVFRNYEKSASEGVVMENGFSTLYGNTLSADDTFLETYGSDFEFIIENHTKNSGMRVSVTANVETEGGHEGILPTITEDKMTATKLKDGSTADYIRFSVTTTEVVFPQTTVLNIVFSEYNEYAVGVSPSSGNFTYTANPVAISGENYTANIKAKTGYDLEITVTRDDGTTTTLTAGQGNDYVWDSSTGALTIYASAVTGDITINCLNDNAIPYTISYTLNGGSVEPANPTKYTVEDTFTLTNPTKTGYNFAGWTGTGLNGATQSVTISQMTGNRSYTATWTIINYTITYNLNGGSVATANPTAYTVESNAFTLTNPTKTGYNFAGWTGTGLGNATKTVTISQMTGDRSYTATWTAKSYTITYNGNGSTSGTMANSTYTYGVSQALFENEFVNKDTYYCKQFLGWSEDPNATKATYTNGQSITISKDTTLYAVWDYVWTIKEYNQTNVTTGYNSNFAGYYYVEMGEYPQTYKSDDAIEVYSTEAKTTNITTSTTTSGTIGYGSDGYRYYWQNAMADQSKDGATHTFGTVHGVNGWYKIEPLRWIIIGGGKSETTTYGIGSTVNSDNLGSDELLLLSEYILYAVPFDGSHYQSADNCQNRYYNSADPGTTSDVWCSINGWSVSRGDSDPATNGGVDYINQADAKHVRENYFIKLSGLEAIMTANPNLIVSKELETNFYAGGTQIDTSTHKIFLLGGSSANSFYITNYLPNGSSMGESAVKGSKLRTGYATGFAHATGAYGSEAGSSASQKSKWWLRTSAGSLVTTVVVHYMNTSGSMMSPNNSRAPDSSDLGVRPSFILNLA